MDTREQATSLSNPRTIAAVYFAILAVVATLVIDLILYELGVVQILPLAQGLLLSILVAGFFGALFGKKIACSISPSHWHSFIWGALMAIVTLVFYMFGFILLMYINQPEKFSDTSVLHFMESYLISLAYAFFLAGIWLVILTGIAAVYLRSKLIHYITEGDQ